MEYRNLGRSGLKVPVLSLGTATFGGTNEFFKAWGETDIREATRLADLSIERGMNFFDTANVYSQGASEEILGAAIKGRRNNVILATKGHFNMGEGPNDRSSSRYHLIKAAEDSLKRLGTDYIDVYFLHAFDKETPIEETLRTLDHLVTSGKVRYIGASNFTAWQLMKSLSVAERHNLEKYVIYQGYYSLIGRDYEQELMPLLQDQGLGLMVWSPLGWGRLTGKIRRNNPLPEGRVKAGGLAGAPPVAEEHLYNVIDVLDKIAGETGKSVSQVAINWLLNKPTVSNIVIGARNETQLLENLNAIGWSLSPEHVLQLDAVSEQTPIYPHWVGNR
ncbi:aldo/keto reductase [Niastella yeongjuensis]|uniref:Aldo/keto reductase n=1 Tax=Niastella yeongjuensis TaxID=354355 RepID=A0A1V9F4R7_9BACT|nr:aldo/keto reductase [Niastella yeongjuensis]OQP53394.1 aldo/keto reductase [Niastella yeongjuensis]SEP13377.1 Predicted oxidoreductase [Niastella yeongjuensis]